MALDFQVTDNEELPEKAKLQTFVSQNKELAFMLVILDVSRFKACSKGSHSKPQLLNSRVGSSSFCVFICLWRQKLQVENVDVRDKMLKEGSKQAAIYFLYQLSNPVGYHRLALMRNYVGNSYMYYLVKASMQGFLITRKK